MEADKAREISERDQLWASLRGLRPEIDALAAGEFDQSPRQQQVMMILARVITAELSFRERLISSE
ncbi:hypothetical protein [Zavarzinella formosa]|uniref:hypothetical protein n=1 Tax=Zavarzinella formosa TaxID=360055 RepID=UPI00030F9F59|nr:hypothetical protein [Zavarzinella formosa]